MDFMANWRIEDGNRNAMPYTGSNVQSVFVDVATKAAIATGVIDNASAPNIDDAFQVKLGLMPENPGGRFT
jgi:hypothetical protein